jgi:hypothetical protein
LIAPSPVVEALVGPSAATTDVVRRGLGGALLWLAVVVLVAVLALDTLPAIVPGVILSLVLLIYHTSSRTPPSCAVALRPARSTVASSTMMPNSAPAWSCFDPRRR